ncbi:hypothetical protein QIS99_14010 [Streptomyces sp. B-S-A8]|uniref:Uncharacterized protein n=1 Tax=Streptomyces solicavernae TaxID=3043614 RepID=A0ABT6RSD7_9ACTN|nr:hypothetical protein [Streptomyces sp. B-S-A8]MDI3387307.1 hypothetical protein [Streptomyces sp. B-S-A8]
MRSYGCVVRMRRTDASYGCVRTGEDLGATVRTVSRTEAVLDRPGARF